MFIGLSKYLSDKLQHLNNKYKESHPTSVQNFSPGLFTETDLSDSTSSNYACIDVVAWFTEVAAFAKEESNFTQYMNFCYTINKNSKPALVKISSPENINA